MSSGAPSQASLRALHKILCRVFKLTTQDKKVYDIIHPERRNLTAIRGYKRIGGLPDDPHSDPQDRSWFGPHDRLFVEAEFNEMDFKAGPEHGKLLSNSLYIAAGMSED